MSDCEDGSIMYSSSPQSVSISVASDCWPVAESESVDVHVDSVRACGVSASSCSCSRDMRLTKDMVSSVSGSSTTSVSFGVSSIYISPWGTLWRLLDPGFGALTTNGELKLNLLGKKYGEVEIDGDIGGEVEDVVGPKLSLPGRKYREVEAEATRAMSIGDVSVTGRLSAGTWLVVVGGDVTEALCVISSSTVGSEGVI